MNACWRRFLHLAAGLTCVLGLAEVPAQDLKHNPFARPKLAPRPAVPDAGAANAINAPLPEPAWSPEIWAIMMAGAKSLVNVEGVLLRIGEQINGYTLIEVQEETAVFANKQKRVTLSLRGFEPILSSPPRQGEREMKARRDPAPRQDERGAEQRRDESRKAQDK